MRGHGENVFLAILLAIWMPSSTVEALNQKSALESGRGGWGEERILIILLHRTLIRCFATSVISHTAARPLLPRLQGNLETVP